MIQQIMRSIRNPADDRASFCVSLRGWTPPSKAMPASIGISLGRARLIPRMAPAGTATR